MQAAGRAGGGEGELPTWRTQLAAEGECTVQAGSVPRWGQDPDDRGLEREPKEAEWPDRGWRW